MAIAASYLEGIDPDLEPPAALNRTKAVPFANRAASGQRRQPPGRWNALVSEHV